MAVPKGKVSRQRRDKRRSSTWKLTPPSRACKACGQYKGRTVINVEESK